MATLWQIESVDGADTLRAFEPTEDEICLL
jgi:hypothetical protein